MTPKVNMIEIISAEDIRVRVAALGRELDAVYGQEPVVAVCVLKGAFIFFADLVRAMSIEPEIDFLRLASYGSETSSSGNVFLSKDLEIDIEGKNVLIVEDIVDTGRSMEYLVRLMERRGAKSVRICALIDKVERRQREVRVDFVGFPLPKGFVVGYGLDYAERYRGLPAVYELKP